MSIKRFVTADATLSLLLHALKAGLALLVNGLVLHGFSVSDFVVWSVSSSVLVVATASDLGIGQYVVTRLIHSPHAEWSGIVRGAFGALLPLALLSALFVCVAIDGPGWFYVASMAIFLALRLLTIPFAAVLNATNQFKIRKAAEFVAYLAAAAAVAAIIEMGGSVYIALVALNASFLMAAFATVFAAARHVPVWAAFRPAPLGQSLEVFRLAMPFMANNLSGLLTYGGFIWLSSLVLPSNQVAVLAVLHSFVLMNLYQVYDVFLKSRQADLADLSRLPPYRHLNWAVMLALPPAFVLLGREALALVSRSIAIGRLEAGLFGLFMALELGNLFRQSVAQVDLVRAGRLKTYALIRTTMLGGFMLVRFLALGGANSLNALLVVLSFGSLLSFLYLGGRRDEISGKRS